MEQEVKHFDTSQGNSGVDWTGTIWQLSLIPQGDTDTTRDGDSLLPQRLRIHCVATAADSYNLMRVIVFRWHPATLPVYGDIMTNAGGSVWSPLQSVNIDNRQNYTILLDRTLRLDPESDGLKQIVKTIKLAKSRPMQFQNGTTQGTNKIYLLAVSDSGAAPNPLFVLYSRLEFTDS